MEDDELPEGYKSLFTVEAPADAEPPEGSCRVLFKSGSSASPNS